MDIAFRIILIAVLSYLLGSFPSAVLISKKFFGFDLREKGSGNMGSTNAFRILGWKWGLMVQVLDLLKGFIAVFIVANLIGEGVHFPNATIFEDITLIKVMAGIMAVAGHIWSVFVKFKGGKGINTAAGMLIGIAPLDVGIAVGIFIIAVLISGYISLGSLLGAITLPFSIFFRYNILHDYIPGYQVLIYFTIGLAGLIIFTHRTNILRLAKGTENRFSKLQLLKKKRLR